MFPLGSKQYTKWKH